MLNAVSTKFLHEFAATLAKSNNVGTVTQNFNISPPIETKLREAILHASSFLQMISVLPKQQIQGQVVDVGNGSLFTGRKKGGRFYKEMGVEGNTYQLVETDSCAAITWETLSQWANAGGSNEFIKMITNSMTKHYASDILRIGFHGTSVAETTDPVANPNGEDVNKGWLAIVKEKAPTQVLAEATIDPTGATAGAHKNLDALVTDLRNSGIAEVHVEDSDLVVLIGRELVASEQARLMGEANVPTEHAAAQQLSKTIGGMKAYIPPFFKPLEIWITSLKNLQVLQQQGTQHRKARNEEDRKTYENSWLRWEGYAVGNLDKFTAIENVVIVGEEAVVEAIDLTDSVNI